MRDVSRDIEKNKKIYIINNIILKNISRLTFNILNNDDIIELIESSLYLLLAHIQNNPLSIMYPSFSSNIVNSIHKILMIQIDFLFINNSDTNRQNNVKDEVDIIIDIASSIFYKYIMPKRSYDKTFIRVQANVAYLKNKIVYLQSIEQAEQRTSAWYEFRHNVLTASNIYKVFGSESMQNQLIYEKCKPMRAVKYNAPINSPLHWGIKYESVSIQYYEYLYKTQVSDFGCIKHNEYDFLAASPDGINTLESSLLYGRMLEIKNIVNRIIDGNPKHEYWVQMQLQMEVCKLNECDFLETRFVEYKSYEDYLSDGTFNKTLENKYKGIIMYFIKDNNPYYEYAPFNVSQTESSIWEENIMEKNSNLTWIQNIYWKLEEVSCVLVLRNKFWFHNALPYIEELWNTIKLERDGNYEHRAPKKQIKKARSNEQDNTLKNTDPNIKIIHTNMQVDNLRQNVCHINTKDICGNLIETTKTTKTTKTINIDNSPNNTNFIDIIIDTEIYKK